MIEPRKSVQGVRAYPVLPGDRRKVIRMDLNESAWGCSPKVLEAIRTVDELDVAIYPSYQRFLQKVAENTGVQPENILVANGADDIIRTIMQTYLDPGERVLMAEPTFGILGLHAKIAGAEIVNVPYEADLRFPVEKMIAMTQENIRMIVIVRPDSPTGALISEKDVVRILDNAPGSLVVLDETYIAFGGESSISLIKKYPNLAVLQSFSKAYGLAGLRLGTAFSMAENIAEMRKVSLPFSLNGVAVKAGIAALADEAFLRKVISEVRTEKDWLVAALAEIGIEAQNSAANFVLANLGNQADDIWQKLTVENIYVKNLKSIPLLKGWFRIAVNKRAVNEKLVRLLSTSEGAPLAEVT